MNKLGVLEGLLFVVGDEGITLEAIMDIMKVSETEAKSLLNELHFYFYLLHVLIYLNIYSYLVVYV